MVRISGLLKIITCDGFSSGCLLTSVSASVLLPGWCSFNHDVKFRFVWPGPPRG